MFVEPIVNFRDQNNWQFAYEEERDAPILNGKPIPIPQFEIAFLLESHILAVKATTDNGKPAWRYAGELRQKIQIGSGGAVSALPNVTSRRIGLFIDEWNLAVFPKFYTEYQLVYVPPKWFKHAHLKIYQYVGPQSSDILQSLVEVKSDLQRIESKIDALP